MPTLTTNWGIRMVGIGLEIRHYNLLTFVMSLLKTDVRSALSDGLIRPFEIDSNALITLKETKQQLFEGPWLVWYKAKFMLISNIQSFKQNPSFHHFFLNS